MQISKRTLPTVRGGSLNKDFVYVNAVSTDVAVTFAKARAAIVVRDRLLDDLSNAVFRARPVAIPMSRLYRA